MAEVRRPSIWRPCITIGVVVLILCWCCWWWWWKCYPCTPTPVAIDCFDHCVVTGDDCTTSEWELEVAAGDVVIWANVRNDTLKINFGTTSPFDIDLLAIPPHEVLVLQVRDTVADGDEFPYRRSCAPGADGPKVKIGGGG